MEISQSYAERDRGRIWARVSELVALDRLKTVTYVLTELERNDPDATKVLRPLRAQLVVSDTELFEQAGRIARGYPRMSRPLATRTKADPWVIALARVHGLTVVTEERLEPHHIPFACQELGVPCITLQQFVSTELSNHGD